MDLSMMSALRVRAASSLSDWLAPFGSIDGGNVYRPTRSPTSHRRHHPLANQPAADPAAPQVGQLPAPQFLLRERGRP
ncbi:hypothetical protein MA6G0728R_5251 [Mycobacteroides abscessus 6G-0728-R]|nr:hypothetical protein MA6G0125S_5515 [Mycobacteroides abscessus 6G-0125-S]EIU64101.1 hypothetical protein MA6G0728S_5218 [Mycobacteroides abscessus 6G-0728-S]EIU74866.1 hypothetical protein MA6G1108_5514 [Mycobacteroides abscessus 6G-1108]EIV02971.1 hypothetical protein MA6G0728R_5251 [Mycobacteroides abscessus 6G-0728-R]